MNESPPPTTHLPQPEAVAPGRYREPPEARRVVARIAADGIALEVELTADDLAGFDGTGVLIPRIFAQRKCDACFN